MKRGIGLVGGLIAVCCAVGMSAPVWADEPSMAGDKAELQVLKARLDKLERKIADQEAAAPASGVGAGVLQLPSGLKNVQLSGFVDTSASYNFNAPHGLKNTLRAFDTESQSFLINNAELNLQKPVSSDSPLGFLTTLMIGTDAPVVGGVTTGLGPGTEQIALQQAYIEYLAPIGEGLDLKAGKFATLHGAEVIESMNDWNFSRSFLFTYAIPFTHTGVRATYPWTKWLSTTVGLVNGWDIVKDNNLGKTLETQVVLTPNDKMSLATCYMVGPEQSNGSGSNSHNRDLIDIVASYQPIDPLQLKVNFDYGFEQKGAAIGTNASWIGVAGYARYALTDKLALASRTEWFNDADGVRTGIRTTAINGVTSNELDLWEQTLTAEYKLNPHLIGRLEYRHDQANRKVFVGGGTQPRRYQDTIGVEFIAPF